MLQILKVLLKLEEAKKREFEEKQKKIVSTGLQFIDVKNYWQKNWNTYKFFCREKINFYVKSSYVITQIVKRENVLVTFIWFLLELRALGFSLFWMIQFVQFVVRYSFFVVSFFLHGWWLRLMLGENKHQSAFQYTVEYIVLEILYKIIDKCLLYSNDKYLISKFLLGILDWWAFTLGKRYIY